MWFKNCFIIKFLMHPNGPCFIKIDHIRSEERRVGKECA